MADPEVSYLVCVILYSPFVAHIASALSFIVIQASSLANCRQLAPRVEAEGSCYADCGKVEADEETTEACSKASDMLAASAKKHAHRVEGQEDHRDATERVNDTKAISSVKAIRIVSTVINNIIIVHLSVFHVMWAIVGWLNIVVRFFIVTGRVHP